MYIESFKRSLVRFTKKRRYDILKILNMLNKNLTKLTKGVKCSSMGMGFKLMSEKRVISIIFCTGNRVGSRTFWPWTTCLEKLD